MKGYKTVIIFDWDDTLFPTTWLTDNGIDLSDQNTQNKFIVYFSKLDMLLYNLLINCLNYGSIFIVTNASAKWINTSMVMLPNTKKIISKNMNINIISARDMHQEDYPNKIDIWKKLTFQNITLNNLNKYKYQHIISIGDAEYEYNALTDLFNHASVTKERLLKTIKLLRNPSFDSLVDQLEVLNIHIDKIIKKNNHMDLKFRNKKFKI